MDKAEQNKKEEKEGEILRLIKSFISPEQAVLIIFNRLNNVPQVGPNSCGKLHFAANMAGEEDPLANQHVPSFQMRIALELLMSAAGPWGCDPSSLPLELYFSGGVLLQLNISTRLSVGPSRSVIYTIFTNS